MANDVVALTPEEIHYDVQGGKYIVLPSSVNGQQNGKVIPSLEGNRDRGFEYRYYLEQGPRVQFLLNLCRPPVRSLLPALQMFVLSQVRQISFNSLYILISAAYSCRCLQ